MLVNPANPDSDFEMRDIQAAARILGRQIHILTASSDADFDGVFATLVKQQTGALIVASDAYFSGRRGRIVALAARHGVAAIYARFELVINLNAAKALGIEISPKLLALADEVIE
jgi:putative ABC transport system substrate-binding protein